ncbi:MAG: hypothetical protein H6718_19905 [Polyangiaceae bacterium]|nr:hypothetical protein [Polyangiaceae bacterium]MCB9605524.1 hypothetical protein [Polyangiaceae bacterium]
MPTTRRQPRESLGRTAPTSSRDVWVVGRCDTNLLASLTTAGWNLQPYVTDAPGPQPSVLLVSWNKGDVTLEEILTLAENHPASSVVLLAPRRVLARAATHSAARRLTLVSTPTSPAVLAHMLASANHVARLEALAEDTLLMDGAGAGPLTGQSTAIRRARLRMSEAYLSGDPLWVSGPLGSGKQWMVEQIHEATTGDAPFEVIDCAELDPSSQRSAIASATERLAASGAGLLCLQQAEHLDARLRPIAEARAYGIHLACWSRAADLDAPTGYCHIEIPPLASRPLDVLWATHSILTPHRLTLDAAAARLLQGYRWPGNYLELERVVLRAVRSARGGRIHPRDLNLDVDWQAEGADPEPSCELKKLEASAIRRALESTNGCKAKAARRLGIGRATLYRRLREMSRNGEL